MSPTALPGTAGPLIDTADALFVDLDGVVHLGDQPVAHAAALLGQARSRGVPLVFVTNNASRTSADVAAGLARYGVTADEAEVLTSAAVTAESLAAGYPPGTPVLVVGGAGLRAAVAGAGLTVVADAAAEPVVVAQGWGPDVCWADLAEASIALRAGASWVVTNRDKTLPSPRGPLPGSGALVAALVTATGREPTAVIGKPQPALFQAALAHTRAADPLVVGDRLDTDIAGARAAGLRSLLVLTGVARPRDLLAAPAGARPDYVGADLRALLDAHPPVEPAGDQARCGGITVSGRGEVTGSTDAPGAPLDGLRAACALAWAGTLPPERYDDVLNALDLE